MRWSILIGGPAGLGPNFVSTILAKVLVKKGFYVFCYREYESRIKGGHNFNIVTFADHPIYSHSNKIDIMIVLDELTEKIHRLQLKKNSFIIKGNNKNVFELAQAFKILGIDIEVLEKELKEHPNFFANQKEARDGYVAEKRSLKLPDPSYNGQYLVSGAESTAIAAIKSDLDFYYVYPMTPATSLFWELAAREKGNKHKTVELESEISAITAAVGTSITGKKSLVGTSGGGFDLMTETLSMCGVAQIPIVIYLAQRTGPGTGAATFTTQGDLLMSLYAGHGEYGKIVAAPGDPLESEEITSQLFYLTQKYKMPGIILTDKHLAESLYTHFERPRLMKPISGIKWPARFSSYITDDEVSSTDKPELIIKDADERAKKESILAKEVEKLTPYKIHGNKDSKRLVIAWGSTKGAIIDALKEIDFKFMQVVYLDPFSDKIKNEIKKAKKVVIIENNATSQLSKLIAQNTGILIDEKHKILKYDGRPFTKEEVVESLKKVLR